ncbi:hypothetical protein T310_8052 [Rasamsonia emersonii CBS 393.64]|uniref:Uncharacterized protein n=1 Tax=Rasamsonia emersonii (strain ATCC 16479 / CBS 393.64 / IMI 116815) TaxID=1408163 RepID=A0A0F4YK76_RASE3|nr:hypothetical protein T310_8052 [Rasamsonia emersonii CBS 393.64]KKA18008.1 hypothetical protein T310_8052 [Rasamsonia emersonii CBS 393.64]
MESRERSPCKQAGKPGDEPRELFCLDCYYLLNLLSWSTSCPRLPQPVLISPSRVRHAYPCKCSLWRSWHVLLSAIERRRQRPLGGCPSFGSLQDNRQNSPL